MTHEQRARRRKAAAFAVADGARPQTVAKRHEITLRTLRRACKEHRIRWPDLPPRSHKIGSSIRILAGILCGHSVQQICKRTGCQKSRVYAVRDEARRCGRLVPGKWPSKFPP
jgi:hypothetical protein